MTIPTVTERFWAKVDKTPGHGPWGNCWVWTGAKHHKDFNGGYGAFAPTTGKSIGAHRFVLELTECPLKPGEQALHRCDNPPCVNPAHIFRGTNQVNVADMVAKGRNAKGERNGSCLHPESRPRGEASGTSRLTVAVVAEIRRARAAGESTPSIAARLGVSPANVSKIAAGTLWRHAPGPLTSGRSNLKMSVDKVRELRAQIGAGTPQKVVCGRLGITSATASKIMRRQIWAHVA